LQPQQVAHPQTKRPAQSQLQKIPAQQAVTMSMNSHGKMKVSD
jgi:hypothetical protein